MNYPWPYWIFAVLASGFYGYRGILYWQHHVGIENARLKEEKLRDAEKLVWTRCQRIVVHYIQDFIYNFVCSLSGFIALYFEIEIIKSLKGAYLDISAGTAATLAFLSLIAIIGISGALPRILWRKGF